MDDDDEDIAFTQQTSLLDENEDGKREKQIGFWRSLFKRRKKGSNEDDPKENSALLGSCPELGYDDDEADGDDGPRRRFITEKPKRTLTCINGDSSDDDIDDDDDDKEFDAPGPRPSHSRSNSFLLVSSEHQEEKEQEGFGLLHASEPILRYTNVRQGKIIESSRASVSSSNSSSSSSDDEGSDGESDSGSDSGSDSEEDHDEDRSPSIPRNFQTGRPRPLERRSYSVGSSFTDDWNSKEYAVHTRKSINGRIQGFGNSAPPGSKSEIVSPMTFRERIRNYRDNRMQKMEIGEDSVGQAGWKSNLENRVIGLVDSVLPIDLENKSQQHATSQAPPQGAVRLIARPSKTGGAGIPSTTPLRSGKRGEFANDDLYIIYLECEVNNKDLELSSWRLRVRELEKEVCRLKEITGEGADDSTVDSSDTAPTDGAEEKSDIEWQTGVPQEGILINLEEKATSSEVKLIEGLKSGTNTEESIAEENSVREGMLIDTSSFEAVVDESLLETSKALGNGVQDGAVETDTAKNLGSVSTELLQDEEDKDIAGSENGVKGGVLLEFTSGDSGDNSLKPVHGANDFSKDVAADDGEDAESEGDGSQSVDGESESTDESSEQGEDAGNYDKEGILIELVGSDMGETKSSSAIARSEEKAVVSDDGGAGQSEDDEVSEDNDSEGDDSGDDDSESSDSNLAVEEVGKEGILIELADEAPVEKVANLVATHSGSISPVHINEDAVDEGHSGDRDSKLSLDLKSQGMLIELGDSGGEIISTGEEIFRDPEPSHHHLVSDDDD